MEKRLKLQREQAEAAAWAAVRDAQVSGRAGMPGSGEEIVDQVREKELTPLPIYRTPSEAGLRGWDVSPEGALLRAMHSYEVADEAALEVTMDAVAIRSAFLRDVLRFNNVYTARAGMGLDGIPPTAIVQPDYVDRVLTLSEYLAIRTEGQEEGGAQPQHNPA